MQQPRVALKGLPKSKAAGQRQAFNKGQGTIVNGGRRYSGHRVLENFEGVTPATQCDALEIPTLNSELRVTIVETFRTIVSPHQRNHYRFAAGR